MSISAKWRSVTNRWRCEAIQMPFPMARVSDTHSEVTNTCIKLWQIPIIELLQATYVIGNRWKFHRELQHKNVRMSWPSHHHQTHATSVMLICTDHTKHKASLLNALPAVVTQFASNIYVYAPLSVLFDDHPANCASKMWWILIEMRDVAFFDVQIVESRLKSTMRPSPFNWHNRIK